MNEIFDRPIEASEPSLRAIVQLSEKAVALERTVAAKDEELTKLRTELNALKFAQIPDAMAEAGMTSFVLSDGSIVKVEDYVQGSLPRDPVNRDKAVGVLESHGGEALIKNQVIASFDKKQHNAAINLAREMQDRGLDVKLQQDVHSSTLQAFVREKLRSGETLPWELLGIFVGRRAKITPAETN